MQSPHGVAVGAFVSCRPARSFTFRTAGPRWTARTGFRYTGSAGILRWQPHRSARCAARPISPACSGTRHAGSARGPSIYPRCDCATRSRASEDQLHRREAAGRWSVAHVLQHLADSELVGAYRFRMIWPMTGLDIQAYDQDLGRTTATMTSQSHPESLDDFHRDPRRQRPALRTKHAERAGTRGHPCGTGRRVPGFRSGSTPGTTSSTCGSSPESAAPSGLPEKPDDKGEHEPSPPLWPRRRRLAGHRHAPS